MVVDDSDGIEEALAGQISVAITAAGLAAEGIVRAREERHRRAESVGEQRARALKARLTAERQSTEAELEVVHHPGWWRRASPEQIGRAWELARAWSPEAPMAARAEQQIADEVRKRYGIDPTNPAAVRPALDRQSRDRTSGVTSDAETGRDRAEAQVLLAQADQLDRGTAPSVSPASGAYPEPNEAAAQMRDELAQAEQWASEEVLRAWVDESANADTAAGRHSANRSFIKQWKDATAKDSTAGLGDGRASAPLSDEGRRSATEASRTPYDSVERRDQTARELDAAGVGKAALTAKMSADVSQARPATDAVKHTRVGRSTRARRGRGVAAQAERSSQER